MRGFPPPARYPGWRESDRILRRSRAILIDAFVPLLLRDTAAPEAGPTVTTKVMTTP
jgi:hypothetical protein